MIEIFDTKKCSYSSKRAAEELEAASRAGPLQARAAHLGLAAKHMEIVRDRGAPPAPQDDHNPHPLTDAFPVQHDDSFDELLTALDRLSQP